MAEKHARKSPQRKVEDDSSSAAPGKAKNERQADEISAITEDVLDDIDRALQAACGFDEDEIISDSGFR